MANVDEIVKSIDGLSDKEIGSLMAKLADTTVEPGSSPDDTPKPKPMFTKSEIQAMSPEDHILYKNRIIKALADDRVDLSR